MENTTLFIKYHTYHEIYTFTTPTTRFAHTPHGRLRAPVCLPGSSRIIIYYSHLFGYLSILFNRDPRNKRKYMYHEICAYTTRPTRFARTSCGRLRAPACLPGSSLINIYYSHLFSYLSTLFNGDQRNKRKYHTSYEICTFTTRTTRFVRLPRGRLRAPACLAGSSRIIHHGDKNAATFSAAFRH